MTTTGTDISVATQQGNSAENTINFGNFSQSNSAPVDIGGHGGLGGAHDIAVAAQQQNHAENTINFGDFSQSNSAPVDIGGLGHGGLGGV